MKKNAKATVFAQEKAKTYNLDEVCEFVAHDFPVRNSGEELKKLLEAKKVDETSFKKLLGRSNAANAGNWLNGNTAISRESAVKILLALNIDNIAEAEQFIMRVCKDGADAFYARDYRDIIYMFCLRHKYGIDKMLELTEQYKHLGHENAGAGDFDKNVTLTEYLENKFYGLETEDELHEFFSESSDYFGSFNRSAYKKFMECYNLAVYEIKRYKSEDTAEKYSHAEVSVDEICGEIANIPDKKKKTGLNIIQKIIAKDEPNRQKLTNIKNKKERVPRKYLILFFLMVWGDMENYKESILTLNEALDECGMPRLDSRNPFDWIVMNSFYYAGAPDNPGAMDRMSKITERVFNI